jgi:hypothetical protein
MGHDIPSPQSISALEPSHCGGKSALPGTRAVDVDAEERAFERDAARVYEVAQEANAVARPNLSSDSGHKAG